MLAEFLNLFRPIVAVFAFLFRFWWIWAGPAFFMLFVLVWKSWRQQLYKTAVSWVLLELKFPREIEKSPKAMEQFFAVLHGVRNAPGDWMETYLDGEVTLWFSLEMMSIGGDTHLYIRTPVKHQKVVTANLYANYPMIEVEPAPDYMEKFARTLSGLYARNLDIWGSELVLAKEDAYPIRTYIQYEGVEEARSIDPIASMLEVFRHLDRKETVCVQILIRPAGDEWREKGLNLVKKLKIEGSKTIVGPLGEYTDRPIRTPGETEVLKSIEISISKSGYESLVRYIYIADKSVYNTNFAKRGTISAFNQHADRSMNFFLHNNSIYTQTKWINYPYFFPRQRAEGRKRRILENYHERKMPEEMVLSRYLHARALNFNTWQRTFVLNTEELATLFHPPTNLVMTGPLIKRVESKRMGPPASMPIFESDQSL
ncbi:MAG: hypothetical protein HY470_00405 [Candidatus Ryanbacteria bacterium]|nr:hypothetical protein [Candidatus Ryanbacteria bacterium]